TVGAGLTRWSRLPRRPGFGAGRNPRPRDGTWGTRFFGGEEGELEAALLAVDTIEQDVDTLAHPEDAAVAGSYDLAVGVAEDVAVVLQGGDGDQAFDEEVVELDEEAVLGAGEDDGVEVLADAVLHELDL